MNKIAAMQVAVGAGEPARPPGRATARSLLIKEKP